MNTTQQRLTTRGQIITLREGLTVRAIADRLAVSTSTVKRWTKRYAETGILTDLGITGRLQFSQQYVGEDPEFWSRVVFTEEKTFASTNHGKINLWRPNCTRAHIYEVVRSGHVTLNVWGYISLHAMGDVFQIKGRFTANKYLD
ncbi:putative Transposable element Tc1 transposase-like 63, partial [Homarus americanus]